MGIVGELVSEDDRELVVVHLLEKSAIDPDGSVAHRRSVPLLGVDDVNPQIRRLDVGRNQPRHHPPHPLDFGSVLDDLADGLPSSSGALGVHGARLDPHPLDLVRGGEDIGLEHRHAVPLRLDMGRQDRAVVSPGPLDLDLVSERDPREAAPLSALDPGTGVGDDALAVDDEGRAQAVLRVALEADLGGRIDGGGEKGEKSRDESRSRSHVSSPWAA